MTMGGEGAQEGKAVVALPEGGFLVIGSTNAGEHGGYDGYLARVTDDGELLWERTYGTPDWDFFESAVIDQNTIVAAGYSYGMNDPAGDLFLVKVDLDGEVLWMNDYGLVGEETGGYVGRRSDGMFVLSGSTGSMGDVDPLPQVAAPLPPAREMGTWDTERVRTAAKGHGDELRAHAVNVNFAPMLDLAGGPDPLGDRTWSSDPATVTAKAGAFAEGMCAAGVYPTFKHFPGHGHSDVDADLEPATTPDLATLEAADLKPFQDLTKSMKGRSLIMSGHLDVPGLTTEGRPFSLDPGAMAYLRNTVGFDGVVVTDELAEMGSITQRGIPVDAAIEQSLVAGNDMALFFGGPSDLSKALDRLEMAVGDGRLSAARVDEALERVLTLKASGTCPGTGAPA